MTVRLQDLEEALRNSPDEWRWHGASAIQDIPPGHLCTYGELAHEIHRRTGRMVGARNVGWLRRHLYELTERDTTIPLHRVAKAGDTRCLADSDRTRRDARILRSQEGSWENPRWWTFEGPRAAP